MGCVSHPQVPAARQCGRCQRQWCNLCVKQLNAAGKLLEVCVKCNAPLQLPHAAPPPSFDLAELLRRPFGSDGLITAVALASPVLLGSLLTFVPGVPGLCLLAYYGSVIGYYFQIIAHIGDGKPGLPGPSDLGDDVASLLKMCARGWLCVLVGSSPYFIWLYLLRTPDTPIALSTVMLVALLGLSYLPAVIVSVVVTDSTLAALYPVIWIKVIARAPRSYLTLVGLFLLALLAFVVMRLVTLALASVLIVGPFLVAALSNLLVFVQAAVVGGFLRRHAEDFGYA